jgi:hypothetical protein
MMIVVKRKGGKFDQEIYDYFFHNVENNLRELGFGDVSVNKKMKEFNKILYDILLKIDLDKNLKNKFKINHILALKYFIELKGQENVQFIKFETYFSSFFDFCFELPLDNMVRETINYKF